MKELGYYDKIEAIATSIIVLMAIPCISAAIYFFEHSMTLEFKVFLIWGVLNLGVGIWSYLGKNRTLPFGIGSIMYASLGFVVMNKFKDYFMGEVDDGVGQLIACLAVGQIILIMATRNSFLKKKSKKEPKSEYTWNNGQEGLDLFEATNENISELRKTKEKAMKYLDND
ncbi:hypothetical protein AAG747_14225 [Rapidithrix thailandica]|uniref:Uncharacterized protein n=1 Tax=Rapidithrix thailandica TaxID=413964 RepID=A0AAW9S9D9_9BACT